MEIKEIVNVIKEMPLTKVSELVKALEEEFGVSAAAPVAVATAQVAGAVDAVEEKTEFNVILTEINANRKAETIKIVKEITGAGLMDAKNMVEKLPATLKEKVATEVAKEIKEKFAAIEAKVELK